MRTPGRRPSRAPARAGSPTTWRGCARRFEDPAVHGLRPIPRRKVVAAWVPDDDAFERLARLRDRHVLEAAGFQLTDVPAPHARRPAALRAPARRGSRRADAADPLARPALLVALEPVVRDGLPRRRVRDERAPARPHAGSPSNAAMRILIWLASSGLRLNRCEPHSRQKHFSKPPSGCRHACTSSSPCSSRNVVPSIRACTELPDPVRFWQRVQWQ